MLDAHSYTEMRRFAQLKSCRMACVQQGGGPAALFLYGFPLNGFQWRNVIPLVASHRTCIAPDLMSLGYTETEEDHAIPPETPADMQIVCLRQYCERAHPERNS